MKKELTLQRLFICHKSDTQTYIFKNANCTKEFRLTIRGRRYIAAKKISLAKAA